MSPGGRVCAVVVTHNRRALLEQCLEALATQTRPVDHVLVVDNASTDGTRELVRERFAAVELLALEANVGGAGGFHAGVEHAYASGFDWLWLMDDDTIPTDTALEELLLAENRLEGLPRALILASTVLTAAGELHPFNKPRPDLRRFGELVEAADRGLVLIRSASFVSLLVHRDAIARYGLPIKEFFIWNDDTEFTARVLRHEAGYMVPRSRVHHKNKVTGGAAEAGERFYFEIRNKLQLLRGDAWAREERLERARIAASVAEGVAVYLRHHRFRPRALRVVARGIADGVRRLPR